MTTPTIWSPAAPVSSARTSATACWLKATTCCAWTISTPAPGATSCTCWTPEFRTDAPRRDFPAVRGSGPHLQPGLPGIADPLPARPGADHQDQRARRDQHAGAGQAHRARILQASTSEVYGDPTVHPQPEAYWGNVNPIGIRSPATTRASAAPRPCFSTTGASTRLPIKVARIFNTYGPRMLPDDGRVVSNFIVQALQGRTSRFTATAARPARSVTWMTWSMA